MEACGFCKRTLLRLSDNFQGPIPWPTVGYGCKGGIFDLRQGVARCKQALLRKAPSGKEE